MDLYKIIKPHIGETFYSIAHGDIIYNGVIILSNDTPMLQFQTVNFNKTILVRPDGKMHEDWLEILYPSKDAYKSGADYESIWNEFAKIQLNTYIEISLGSKYYNENMCDEYIDVGRYYFNSVEDRTKCVNKIKEILDIYKK